VPAYKMRVAMTGTILLVLSLVAEPGVGQSQSTTQISPATLVKSVIYNEMHPASQETAHWKYKLEKTLGGRQETRTVVETQSGSLDRLLAVGGTPLTELQQAEEAKRILRFSHSPEEQRKAEQARQKDADQYNAIFKMIPDAFIFQQTGQSGDATRLSAISVEVSAFSSGGVSLPTQWEKWTLFGTVPSTDSFGTFAIASL